MFLHVFLNRLKCFIKDKEVVIWLFLFPILLGTMFKVAIPNAETFEKFEPANIAIVDNVEYKENTTFKEAISSVSNLSNTTKDEDIMFNVKVISESEAKELLNNNDIIGYIKVEEKPNIIVKESGFKQTILKEFVNNYLQVYSQINNILKQNPSAYQNLMSQIGDSQTYLKEVSATESESNNSLVYFYALIAMACLYGGTLGLKEVIYAQADQSPQGARVALAPIHKLKLFFCSIFTATVLQTLIVSALLAYLILVLNVDFGTKIGYVILTTIVGSLAGVSYGALIGALVKGTDTTKQGILISITMTLSFFAGLMIGGMKYAIATYAPIFSYLNPANLISDALYSLYYYDTYARFFTNIGLLISFSIVCYLIVFFKMRRQRYASI